MKAMILAAGLGTRLAAAHRRPPQGAGHSRRPHAAGDRSCRLRSFGVDEVIVNAHHYAEQILEYLKANDNFGIKIEVLLESELLDTGGGLKQAAAFFLDSAKNSNEPFLLHNVDVLSSIDFAHMIRFHTEQNALATLAVQARKTSRYLLFDEQNQLCGRRTGENGDIEQVRPADALQPLAFTGIHILSPQIFAKMTEVGAFSIIPTYLRLAAHNEKIMAFRADECYWRDLGKPESLLAAEAEMNSGKYTIA